MKTNKLVFRILTVLSLLMIVATTIDIVVTCIINPERWTMIRSALGENLFIIVFDLLILGVIPLNSSRLVFRFLALYSRSLIVAEASTGTAMLLFCQIEKKAYTQPILFSLNISVFCWH